MIPRSCIIRVAITGGPTRRANVGADGGSTASFDFRNGAKDAWV